MYGKWTSNHMQWYKDPMTGLHCGGVMDIFCRTWFAKEE
jgi:hypothetical protein